MDGRRMTGPEPWMASSDDAMEAQPLRGGESLQGTVYSWRAETFSNIEAAQRGIIVRCELASTGP